MPLGDMHGDVIAWYRDQLAQPARFPWDGLRWEPVRIGPTWRTGSDGRWVLPESTIGWDVLGFCGCWMQHSRGVPWRFTLEQARFILWWYEVDERGRFVNYAGVLQRLKGWGKDPLAAAIAGNDLVGPARVAYMDGDTPVAVESEEPWVQTAATNQDQTKNLMKLYPGLWTPEAVRRFGLQIGRERVYAHDGAALMEAVTSSPAALEGARASLVIPNETHHWRANNQGHDMAEVIDRNSAKSEEGGARVLAITNAYEPGEDSVAQRDREAYESGQSGASLTSGILYDSVEAPPDAPLSAEACEEVVTAVRGDSVWLDTERIRKFILDIRNPPSRSRRFWYNQIEAEEDAWIVPRWFQACAKPVPVADGDRIVMFFDGSKSDDATGLVGCRVEDGHVFTLGMWQRPPGVRGRDWVVPVADVDRVVAETWDRYRVQAFWGDPSHVLDDETQDRFWDGTFDEWHRRYSKKIRKRLWAVQTKHAVMWDMAAPSRTAEFTDAAQRTAQEIEASFDAVMAGGDPSFTWDGDGRLRSHVENARRVPNKYGFTVAKKHRESSRKIDLAVCMIGARMLARTVDLRFGRKAGKVY